MACSSILENLLFLPQSVDAVLNKNHFRVTLYTGYQTTDVFRSGWRYGRIAKVDLNVTTAVLLLQRPFAQDSSLIRDAVLQLIARRRERVDIFTSQAPASVKQPSKSRE